MARKIFIGSVFLLVYEGPMSLRESLCFVGLMLFYLLMPIAFIFAYPAIYVVHKRRKGACEGCPLAFLCGPSIVEYEYDDC